MHSIVGTDRVRRRLVKAMLSGDETFLPSLEMAEFVRNAAFEVEMPLVIAILAPCS